MKDVINRLMRIFPDSIWIGDLETNRTSFNLWFWFKIWWQLCLFWAAEGFKLHFKKSIGKSSFLKLLHLLTEYVGMKDLWENIIYHYTFVKHPPITFFYGRDRRNEERTAESFPYILPLQLFFWLPQTCALPCLILGNTRSIT